VLLFLALEDVQGLAALNTPLLTATGGAAGDRLRFFVGMAHLKPIRSSNRLVVSSSQVEINADITTSYQYTTQTSTDFTFIRDVRVQLSEERSRAYFSQMVATRLYVRSANTIMLA